MPTHRIALTGEKETLLITLAAKAGESRLSDSLLHDRFAADALERIDYDFGRLKVNRDMMIGVALRAHIFDGYTRDFLVRHPDATVLHLGCGLDSRVFRLDPPASVRWFDVDYPEVIELRRQLYPARAGYTPIGASVTAPEWLDAVPTDRPTMILAEGLLPYLPADAVVPLLRRLTAHFPEGGELAFDGFSRLGLRMLRRHPSVKATGAALHWSIEDPRELSEAVPGLELLSSLGAYDPDGYDARQVARMSLGARLMVRLFAALPSLGNSSRLLRYRFGPAHRT